MVKLIRIEFVRNIELLREIREKGKSDHLLTWLEHMWQNGNYSEYLL